MLLKFISTNFPAFTINIQSINQIELIVERVHYRKNEVLFAEGKSIHKIVIIEEGCLMAYNAQNGPKVATRFWIKNQLIFLSQNLINSIPSNQSIIALDECTLLMLNYNKLIELINSNISNWLIIHLFNSLEIASLQNQIELLKLNPKERYHRFMQTHPQMIQLITADLIASYLNIGYSTFARFRQSRD